jgi:predicted RNA-binding protein with EMAP domain
MKEIHEEIKEAIKGLESFKYKYPKMETQDVIDILKRLNENVKLTIPVVSHQRELLKAFLEHYEDTIDFLPAEPSELIDDYFDSL